MEDELLRLATERLTPTGRDMGIPGCEDWVYRDLPGRLSFEMWNRLLGIMGHGNYMVLAMSQGPDWRRGQFLVSPDGMANLKAYSEERARAAADRGRG